MSSNDTDILMRLAAFKRVEMLSKMHGHLTHRELSAGFIFQDERIPLVNPQRGIFKPRQMRYLLSIKMLEALKLLDGGKIHLPRRSADFWDRDRLARRYELFRKAA